VIFCTNKTEIFFSSYFNCWKAIKSLGSVASNSDSDWDQLRLKDSSRGSGKEDSRDGQVKKTPVEGPVKKTPERDK